MKKVTYFLLAALALVTIAAVLAITLTSKKAEKRKEESTTFHPTEVKEVTGIAVTEDYELSTNDYELSTDDYELSTNDYEYAWIDYSELDHNTESTVTYSPDDTTNSTPTPEEIRCSEMTGEFVDKFVAGRDGKDDVEKILEKYGGAPGKLNVTWTEKADPPLLKSEIEMKPLPDADEKYWVYKYRESDGETYIRTEHAVRRFSGTPRAFLEIRGDVYFTPEDYCGNARRAEYMVDDRGFTFEVSRAYCWIGKVSHGGKPYGIVAPGEPCPHV